MAVLEGHIVGWRHIKEHVDEGGGIGVGKFTWGLVRHGLKEIEELGGGGDSPLFSQHNLCHFSHAVHNFRSVQQRRVSRPSRVAFFKVQVHRVGSDQRRRMDLEIFDQLFMRVEPNSWTGIGSLVDKQDTGSSRDFLGANGHSEEGWSYLNDEQEVEDGNTDNDANGVCMCLLPFQIGRLGSCNSVDILGVDVFSSLS
jgi:hypothetical protein